MNTAFKNTHYLENCIETVKQFIFIQIVLLQNFIQ